MNCPKCNTWLTLTIPRKLSKKVESVKIICKCGYKSENVNWYKYIKTEGSEINEQNV